MKYQTFWSNVRFFPEKQSAFWTHCLDRGLVTLLCSSGREPLKCWGRNLAGGSIQRQSSEVADGLVIELSSPAFCATSISLPADPREKIGTCLPILNLLIESMNRPFCFEFCLRDNAQMKRKFRMSTSRRRENISELLCHMPLRLSKGSNLVIIDLPFLMKHAYGGDYAEFLSIQIYANCRIRRVYFSDRTYEQYELPEEYRLKRPKARCWPIPLGRDVP